MTNMAKDLVIVESPAKARTIEQFLGNKYVAMASMGHVRDLPRRDMGVVVNDGSFKPTYKVLPEKRKVVSELARASREAKTVYLATDPDREGEAISWHLIKAAKIDEAKVRRVVFHEITQRAVQEAFDNPRKLDQHLVDAQQARRILDRLVGYDLSPVLWRKVRSGLSAGRVQSVALRLIVDREREIEAFNSQEYWSIDAELANRPQNGKEAAFKAELRGIKGQKGRLRIPNEQEARRITTDLEGAGYRVRSVLKKERRGRPAPPFITSTLQQEAWRKLRFTARRTMVVAQQLYEGIALGEQGSVGLITYMRTDSTNVSGEALREASSYIKERFGAEFAPGSPRLYRKKVKGAQEAHEAIRPTSISREPDSIKGYLRKEQYALYDLVWRRMLASQMPDALFDATTVEIDADCVRSDARYSFRAVGSVLKFPGFRKLYMEDIDDSTGARSDETAPLPELADGEPLDCLSLVPDQKFTQPPPRYTEATLVRAMEEKGIGRPSTYAPTIATVMDRDYVRKDRGRFVPSKLGTAVNGLLTAHFPDIIDVGFTARVEEELDEIASGQREWEPVLSEFYGPFTEAVKNAMENAERVPRDQIDEETDEVCEVCERPMVIKSAASASSSLAAGSPSAGRRVPWSRVWAWSAPSAAATWWRERAGGREARDSMGAPATPNVPFLSTNGPSPSRARSAAGFWSPPDVTPRGAPLAATGAPCPRRKWSRSPSDAPRASPSTHHE
jgi:DNA topoisomerase-1